MSASETRTVYNARWRKVRLAILLRDGYTCQIRGPHCTGAATDVDHIVPWRAGGAPYDEDNLRAACETCNRGRAWREVKRHPSRAW